MPPTPPAPFKVCTLISKDVTILRAVGLDPKDYVAMEVVATAPPVPQAIGDVQIGADPTHIPVLIGTIPFFVPYAHRPALLNKDGQVAVDVPAMIPIPPTTRLVVRRSDLPQRILDEADALEAAIRALPPLPLVPSMPGTPVTGGSQSGGNEA